MSSSSDHLHQFRKDYEKAHLDESTAGNNPFILFETWFNEALVSGTEEPNAMVLSTVSTSAQPSSRVVLLRDADEEGFTFYTNYESKKGQEIANNSKVALNFFWYKLEKQIRIEGIAEKVPAQVSDAYFNSRPVNSRLGAIVSAQSKVLQSRKYLEDQLAALTKKAELESPQRPETWGGYKVIPHYFEFWQGRRSRLHDRLVFSKNQQEWQLERLYP